MQVLSLRPCEMVVYIWVGTFSGWWYHDDTDVCNRSAQKIRTSYSTPRRTRLTTRRKLLILYIFNDGFSRHIIDTGLHNKDKHTPCIQQVQVLFSSIRNIYPDRHLKKAVVRAIEIYQAACKYAFQRNPRPFDIFSRLFLKKRTEIRDAFCENNFPNFIVRFCTYLSPLRSQGIRVHLPGGYEPI